jgi:hypothetical protein
LHEEKLPQEEQQKPRRRHTWGGSKPGRRPNIERDRAKFHDILMKDYFDENPTYDDKHFCRRFRMRRVLFNRIKEELLRNHAAKFKQSSDALGKPGFSTEQMMTAALRCLAYGSSADSLDEYLRMAESTVIEKLMNFCDAIIASYSSFYLKKPTEEDLRYILAMHSARGFPGKLGSIDVMHWEWKNCPAAWAGQYKSGKCTFAFKFVIVLLDI